jgi:hypothetical protein
VANALETGSLVVHSQAQGTAVPEVIGAVADTALSGSFAAFGLRELLDFLTNAGKSGSLEIEMDRERIWVHLERGRIQAVVADAVDVQEIAATVPEALSDLTPILNFSVPGGSSAQLGGIVELLDRKVLDPRLLRSLLRHQAAMLIHRCFACTLKGFRLETARSVPVLFAKLPLQLSLAALLVEAALACPETQLPPESADTAYVRRTVRGQNLDRTGLSAQHMKLLGMLEKPLPSSALARQVGLDPGETRRVLHGLVLADWVQTQLQSQARMVIALETDPAGALELRELLAREPEQYAGKVVRDRLGLQLLLKRTVPDVLLVALDSDEQRKLARELRGSQQLGDCKLVGIVPPCDPAGAPDAEKETASLDLDAVLRRPYTERGLTEMLDWLFGRADKPGVQTDRTDDPTRPHFGVREHAVVAAVSEA